MKIQRLLTYGVKAIEKYKMIEKNDKIAIGISGGKDSLTTFLLLLNIKKYFKKDIELFPIAIDCASDNDYSNLESFFRENDCKLNIVRTEISNIVFNVRKEKNPCSLCAKMRKAALFQKAEELGCNKVALGHNLDDMLETFFMSLFEEGRIHTFPCNTYLDKTKITVIRPLIYVKEKDIVGLINKYDLGRYIVKNKCPVDGKTERENMRLFLKDLRARYDHLDDKMLGAIEKAQIDGYKN